MTLESNSVYIVPDNIKRNLLIELSKEKDIKNIKFFSLIEIIDMLTFSYDEKSIVYLIEKYNLKYNNAIEILNNIRYIEDKKYNNKKLDNLLSIKKELESFLIDNSYLIELLKDKNIYLYGYDYIDKKELELLKKIDVKFISKERKNYNHDVYKFNDMFDEVVFICNKIRSLLEQGIDISKIKIISLPTEYNYIIKLLFRLFDLDIYINNENIYSTKIVQDFLNIYENDDDISNLSQKYNLELESNLYIYNKIIELLNKYSFITNKSTKKEVLINELKKIKTNKNHYQNEIEIKDINNISDDEYAFLLGFNEGNYLNNIKDEDYLSDKEKNILGLDTSTEKFIKIKSSIIENIKSIKNLTISYKLNTSFQEYFVSNLVEDLGYEIKEISNQDYGYSNSFNKLLLSKDLDKLVKYSEKNNELEVLYSNYNDIGFMSYDNRYKGIDNSKLYKYINNKLVLSYSSIDNYYKCKYRYYLNNILKIDKHEDTFSIFIGNLFHYILSICFKDNFDFEKEYNEYLKRRELSKKELFFIERLKEDLLFIIETIKKQYSHSTFKEALYENKYSINKDSIINVEFIGYIDKVLYKEYKGKTLLVIVDYKTGNQDLNLGNTYYGLNLQLPIYLYLSNNSELKNVEVVGFYLQKILNNEITINKSKSYQKQKEENLKLQGYSIYDEELLNEFDDTYCQSEIIKSLSKTNDGFRSYSKLLTRNQMKELYNLVDRKIDEARDRILQADFEIDPKKIGFDNVSCKYCNFKDVCFMKEDDIKILDEIKTIDFLGGDDNANMD